MLSDSETSLEQLDVKEDHDAGDVINHIFLHFPLVSSFFHDAVRCLFGLSVLIVRQDDLGYLLVREELPHTVGSYHDEPVVRLDVVDVYLCSQTNIRHIEFYLPGSGITPTLWAT